MTQTEPRELTREDLRTVFVQCTTSMHGGAKRWADRADRGLTDDELESALSYEMGEHCGRCGPNEISSTAKRSGLRIWASWNTVCPDHDLEPVFQGTATMRMARHVYGIKDPTDNQIDLFG